MAGALILLFVSMTLLEMSLLFRLVEGIGSWWTLAIVILTGILGGWLARLQGAQVYAKIHSDLASSRIPKESLVDAAMIFVAGAFLITPGVITDAIGFSLLVPPIRAVYRKAIWKHLKNRIQVQTFSSSTDAEVDASTIDSPGWRSTTPDTPNQKPSSGPE